MKASLSTMRLIGGTDRDLLEIGIDELKKLATNRLGGLEGVIEYGKRFDDIVVAKIVSCVDHPDSDHLHVCMIDDGGATKDVERNNDGLVQVVCGAPNAREGISVAWLPPGATVPKSLDEAEPFVLGTREIRGQVSNGMLASPSELGLFENHDGILEINESEAGTDLMKPGTEFKKLYGLDDVLLDFENKMFTHRPDCFGQIGLARELAAIQGMKYQSPEWYWKIPQFESVGNTKISVFNDVDSQVPRIMAVAMTNVKVGESPTWLKSFIVRMGGKPVNNVVDVSNYIMHLTGQPTHAYDLKKLDNATIGARMANEGEQINLLNGKSVTLTTDDIVIADGKGPVGIAGVMGGADSEVDDTTTDVLLEVASFDMYSIRRSSMRHGLFTDAVTRFSKGQSPLQNDRVLAKFMEVLTDVVGAKQSSEVVDYQSDTTATQYDRQYIYESVQVNAEFINSRLGTNLSADDISQILRNVQAAVHDVDNGMEVTLPFWRTDIELKEDIVEEVGRLYGFDQLDLKLPQRSIKPAAKNELNEYKTNLRNALASCGANEVLSYSFVHGDTLRKMGIEDVDKWCYHIRNALSPDLQYYRPSMMPSLLTKVQQNLRSDMVRSDDNEFALFEIGKVHVKDHVSIESDATDPRDEKQALPDEMERLVLLFAADEKTAGRKYHGSAIYQAKQYLLAFVSGPVDFAPLESNEYPITAPYEKAHSATISINGQILGVVGEFRSSVRKAFKLPDYCAGFELDLTLLRANMVETGYSPIGTFPKTQADITLAVDQKVPFADLLGCLRGQLTTEQSEHGYQYRVSPRNIYQAEGANKVHYTFRVWLWHPNKTLKTEEVNAVTDRLADKSKCELKAERV